MACIEKNSCHANAGSENKKGNSRTSTARKVDSFFIAQVTPHSLFANTNKLHHYNRYSLWENVPHFAQRHAPKNYLLSEHYIGLNAHDIQSPAPRRVRQFENPSVGVLLISIFSGRKLIITIDTSQTSMVLAYSYQLPTNPRCRYINKITFTIDA